MHTLKSFVLSVAITTAVEASAIHQRATPTQPNWFQTSPNLYAGTVATGAAPFLAESNPAPFGNAAYVPNAPLETSEPIQGAKGRNIFHLMGDLSPYFSPPEGFGVNEHPLPKGAYITQMHMLQRHGARYPSSSEGLDTWGAAIANATAKGHMFSGKLEFLNQWSYNLGKEILVPQGRQELFDAGVLNFYNYGHLYDNSNRTSKLVVRTTLQARMLESCENFLAGFFGLNWRDHANILATIDPATTGQSACTKASETMMESIQVPVGTWMATYLQERTAELRRLTGSYNWTVTDTYHAQALCPYETISLGYSDFCQLFTYEDWENWAYLMDLEFAGLSGFHSPTGRAQGIAFVEEFLARVEGHLLEVPANTTGANLTLDTNPVTFPLDQKLYLEFTHDANIVSVLTAFGLTQFADPLPLTGPTKDQQFHSSRIVPFAGRLNIEIISAPHRVSTTRSSSKAASKNGDYVTGSGPTQYVHFIQNQRTIPLHASFDECEYREDGWCELSTFLEIQRQSLAEAQYQYACFGNWTMKGWGAVTDGVPA
ncbi:histidine phosphatase family protein [Aspergillus aculeatinus CBS 121060]|uniref:Acid phosphatase n=1 Tax=Aspergillus aculeatinus CBS 121060 TaxID=1448322 RepID=A0ACD1H108_9EURO|nr:putative acid phosphatase [Aspergillus aculeatinus CBS 121060]RAH67258.1 putative acid phosphatase [Aspergillus aculeatinus CBS 121060]